MLDIFSQYATDEALENQGTWVEHGDAMFLIARSGNRKYIKLLSTEVEKNQQLLDKKDEAADALSDKIMINTLADSVLLGWENVGYKGAPLEYSKDNAKMLLGVKDFRRLVAKWADDITHFKAKQEAEQAKN